MSMATTGHMSLVIVGATGMIGGCTLRRAPDHPSVIAFSYGFASRGRN
jgi:hypothetical protein